MDLEKISPSHPPYQVLGIGSLCIDLLLQVDDQFLDQIDGEKGGSQFIEWDTFNQILSLSPNLPKTAAGGSSANVIKGLAHLDQRCAFLGQIGTDPLSRQFAEEIKQRGITGLFFPSSQPSPRVLCLITPDGQRTMRFTNGYCSEMADIPLHFEFFKGVKLVHLDGYTLRSGNLAERVMKLASQAGATISFDLSSFEIIEEYHARIFSLISRYPCIIFTNEDEIRALTGFSSFEGCRKLQERCSIAVVMMGKEGCLVGHESEIIHSPASPVNPIDTTGAGDLFSCGFLFGYLKGYPIEKCAQIGNLLGAEVVQVEGAELSSGKWQEIKKKLG